MVNIAVLGYGTVGSGVVEVINTNHESINKRAGQEINIKYVLDLRDFPGDPVQEVLVHDYEIIVNDPEVDIVVEVMGGIEPAYTFVKRSLLAGKNVATSNKALVAKHGAELLDLAKEKGLNFLFEASVGGGIPIIRPLKQCLAANKITKVMGIVNGTTNYMLTKMTEEKLDFPVVLKEAQDQGYAESDPTADVGGFDAGRKIAILASIAFNTRFGLDQVSIEGIETIGSRDIEYAAEFGYVVKLLAIAEACEKGINLRVHPTFLSKTHPLSNVGNVFNAIFVSGDAVGDVMFYGRGAGKTPTASAVCADIMDIAKNIVLENKSFMTCGCYDHKPVCSVDEMQFPFYIRLLVADRPGALSAISAAFGSQQVSLRSVLQKRQVNGNAELVVVTHKVQENNLRMAIQTLEVMPIVSEICNVIRVEDDDFEE